MSFPTQLDANESSSNSTLTNSDRLNLILSALTGDSEPAIWPLYAVRALTNEVRRRGIKDETDPDATRRTLDDIQEMLQRLAAALVGLPKTLPVPKSPEDISKLKANWAADPCWDIETTEGFEAHSEDLLTYRLGRELQLKTNQVRAHDTVLQTLATALGPYLQQG